jgi:hypothetical protein
LSIEHDVQLKAHDSFDEPVSDGHGCPRGGDPEHFGTPERPGREKLLIDSAREVSESFGDVSEQTHDAILSSWRLLSIADNVIRNAGDALHCTAG